MLSPAQNGEWTLIVAIALAGVPAHEFSVKVRAPTAVARGLVLTVPVIPAQTISQLMREGKLRIFLLGERFLHLDILHFTAERCMGKYAFGERFLV